jgi:hypothetical protein
LKHLVCGQGRVARFFLTQYTKTRENIPNYQNITDIFRHFDYLHRYILEIYKIAYLLHVLD